MSPIPTIMCADTQHAIGNGNAADTITARLNEVGLPALICDDEGCILALNSGAVEMLAPEAAPGMTIAELASSENDVSAIQRFWQSRSKLRTGGDFECRLRGRHGDDRDLHMVVILVNAGPREVWLAVISNLTEALIHSNELEIYARDLSELYQKNKRQLVRLQEAEKSREHFYSVLHHELKSPLTSLKAAQEMLGSPEAGVAQSGIALRLLDNMSRSTARLERLITDLLDVATARSGGLSLHRSSVDMVSIIDQVIGEMTPAANDKEVSIVGKWRKKQGLMVLGDEIRLQQIVANILSNAIKAAPTGGIVRVEAVKAAPYAKISVANPSVRLDPKVKDKIFEPFQKSSAEGYNPGAGLGLSVADSLVKAHGGHISVEDTGRQVRFTFTIPLLRKGASK